MLLFLIHKLAPLRDLNSQPYVLDELFVRFADIGNLERLSGMYAHDIIDYLSHILRISLLSINHLDYKVIMRVFVHPFLRHSTDKDFHVELTAAFNRAPVPAPQDIVRVRDRSDIENVICPILFFSLHHCHITYISTCSQLVYFFCSLRLSTLPMEMSHLGLMSTAMPSSVYSELPPTIHFLYPCVVLGRSALLIPILWVH